MLCGIWNYCEWKYANLKKNEVKPGEQFPNFFCENDTFAFLTVVNKSSNCFHDASL